MCLHLEEATGCIGINLGHDLSAVCRENAPHESNMPSSYAPDNIKQKHSETDMFDTATQKSIVHTAITR